MRIHIGCKKGTSTFCYLDFSLSWKRKQMNACKSRQANAKDVCMRVHCSTSLQSLWFWFGLIRCFTLRKQHEAFCLSKEATQFASTSCFTSACGLFSISSSTIEVLENASKASFCFERWGAVMAYSQRDLVGVPVAPSHKSWEGLFSHYHHPEEILCTWFGRKGVENLLQVLAVLYFSQ